MFTDQTGTIFFNVVSIVVAVITLSGCRSVLESRDDSRVSKDDVAVRALSRLAGETDGLQTESIGSTAKHEAATEHQSGEFQPADSNNESNNDSQEILQVSFDVDASSIQAISLQQALNLAIENSEFINDNSSFLSGGNPLLNDPQFLPSQFDVELQQASQQGIEAALASFDAQIATGFQWGRNSVLQARSNLLSTDLLINDNSNFYGRLDKPFATGTTFSVINNLNYANSTQSLPLDPRYTGFVRGEIRHPLLAGRGRRFTEIAGPNSYRSRQLNNGVALAEISEQTAELEFNMALARLLKQTEELYWDYWLAVEISQNQQSASENANEIWSRIEKRSDAGLEGGGAAEAAQAEENYYRQKVIADSARVDLEQASARLRHVIGMPDEMETFICVSDRPSEIPFVFDTESSISNGMQRRLELAKQDLQIQAIQFQLFAARQLQRPQLDLVSGVQLNGLGDDLFDAETGALAGLIDTDDVGWNVGFEFSMPLGFKRERLNTRYLKLLLAKAEAARAGQEKEIRHEISFTSKTVEKWSQSIGLTKKRLAASQRRLAAVTADFSAGRTNLDLLLRSQDAVSEAKIELSRATVELTKAQIELLFRQGVTSFSNLDGS